MLEQNIVMFVRDELNRIQKLLSPDYSECSEARGEDEKVKGSKDEKQWRISRAYFLQITLHFLRIMKQEELAGSLQSSETLKHDEK